MRVSCFGKLFICLIFYGRHPVVAASKHHPAGDAPVWVIHNSGPNALFAFTSANMISIMAQV